MKERNQPMRTPQTPAQNISWEGGRAKFHRSIIWQRLSFDNVVYHLIIWQRYDESLDEPRVALVQCVHQNVRRFQSCPSASGKRDCQNRCVCVCVPPFSNRIWAMKGRNQPMRTPQTPAQNISWQGERAKFYRSIIWQRLSFDNVLSFVHFTTLRRVPRRVPCCTRSMCAPKSRTISGRSGKRVGQTRCVCAAL